MTPLSLKDFLAMATSEPSSPDVGNLVLIGATVLTLIVAVVVAVVYTRRQRNADERANSLAHDPQLRIETYKTMSARAPGRPNKPRTSHLVLVNHGKGDAFNVQVDILQWDSKRIRKMSVVSINKEGGRADLGLLLNKVRYVETLVQWNTVDGKLVERRLVWKR